MYDLPGTVPTLKLNNPTPAYHDNFGASVAISDARIVVGAYFDDTDATDAGIAYLYDTEDTAGPTKIYHNPSPAVDDRFGGAVAISGDHVVVGAWYDDPEGAMDAGNAYVFGPGPLPPFNQALGAAGLGGAKAHPLSTPFGDGTANLIKYAFNLNLATADLPPPPVIPQVRGFTAPQRSPAGQRGLR